MIENLWGQVLLVGYFVPVFLVGMAGNIWVATSVVRILNRTRRSPFNHTFRHMAMYIWSLSLADMAVLCMIPILLSYFYDGHWRFGLAGCKLFFAVENTNKLLSVAILTVMSFERFIAVSRPFSWFCCSVWGVVFCLLLLIMLLCSPMIYYAELKPLHLSYSDGSSEISTHMVCGSNLPDQVMPFFVCYMFLLGFVLPLLFISLCYFFLIQHLRNTRATLEIWPRGQGMFVTACTTKVVRSVLRVVGFHMICWGPFWLFVLIPIVEYFQLSNVPETLDNAFPRNLRMASSFLPYLNSAGNWVFYAAMNRELRDAVGVLWGGSQSVTSSHQQCHTVGTPLGVMPAPADSIRCHRGNGLRQTRRQNGGGEDRAESGDGLLLVRALLRPMDRRRCVSAQSQLPLTSLRPLEHSHNGEQVYTATLTDMV